jgi:regulator of replication initiation timing
LYFLIRNIATAIVIEDDYTGIIGCGDNDNGTSHNASLLKHEDFTLQLEEQRYKILQLEAQLRQEREKNAELTVSNSKLVEQVISANRLEREKKRKESTAMRNRMLAINALHHQSAEEYHRLYYEGNRGVCRRCAPLSRLIPKVL